MIGKNPGIFIHCNDFKRFRELARFRENSGQKDSLVCHIVRFSFPQMSTPIERAEEKLNRELVRLEEARARLNRFLDDPNNKPAFLTHQAYYDDLKGAVQACEASLADANQTLRAALAQNRGNI